MSLAAGPILLATRSRGKLRELRALFAIRGLRVIDLTEAGIAETPEEDAVEAFESFEENALAKARYFARASGLATVADDSGLEVTALGGRPGVRSKRWSIRPDRPDLAGEALDAANNALLLATLAEHADRSARYVCVAAFRHGAEEFARRGEVEGEITATARGFGGFGYDPYFCSREIGRTFGEASLEEKATVSHRARAFGALLTELEERTGGA